jgi:hypothetical protein
MKTQIFFALTFSLIITHLQASNLPETTLLFPQTSKADLQTSEIKGNLPTEIKIVFSQKRIWLLADEMPMKCLKTQIKNEEGKIVFEKCFTSKCADWSLNIESLPKGEYTLYLGTNQVEKFKK